MGGSSFVMSSYLNDGRVGLNLPPPVVDPDDPLLIAQTLTYVTDDGSVLLSFTPAPFSFSEYCICIYIYIYIYIYVLNADLFFSSLYSLSSPDDYNVSSSTILQ